MVGKYFVLCRTLLSWSAVTFSADFIVSFFIAACAPSIDDPLELVDVLLRNNSSEQEKKSYK